MWKEAEMEVDGEVPQEESAEIHTEETQDHVCETFALRCRRDGLRAERPQRTTRAHLLVEQSML